MYAIYGNIYHQYTPVMSAYIPYMDPMGITRLGIFRGQIPLFGKFQLSTTFLLIDREVPCVSLI